MRGLIIDTIIITTVIIQEDTTQDQTQETTMTSTSTAEEISLRLHLIIENVIVMILITVSLTRGHLLHHLQTDMEEQAQGLMIGDMNLTAQHAQIAEVEGQVVVKTHTMEIVHENLNEFVEYERSISSSFNNKVNF